MYSIKKNLSYLFQIQKHRYGNCQLPSVRLQVDPNHSQDGLPRRHRRKSYRKAQLHFLVEHLLG